MNPVRSILAIFGGLGVILFTTQALEVVLVRATAGDAFQNLDAFLMAANQPGMLVAKLVYSGLMAVLGGYLVAKVASTAPMAHAVFAAGLLAAANISGYMTDELAAFTPVAIRAALVVVMSGALLVGATVRLRAGAVEAAAGGLPATGATGRDARKEKKS